MEYSIPVFKKPHPQLSVQDWNRNIENLRNEARTRRFESYDLRQRATQLRNEASITTHWDCFMNTQLLRDRKFEVECHRERQRFTREAVRDEIHALKEEKNATELMLEGLQIPLSVSSQCLGNREQRVPPELTRDELGDELKKELEIIENSKRMLTDICHVGWVKLKDLTNIFCRLEREIKNKDETIALEQYVKDLNRDSSNISFKIDPTRIPAETISEEEYIKYVENTLQIAEQIMFESRNVRETMFKYREECKNSMDAQCQAVELVMRRRVFDIQTARNEMEWQKYKLEDNLHKLDIEIRNLREAVVDKINPTKLVETRLETRTRRPVLERVNDRPYKGLVEEFERVHLSFSTLEQRLEEALTTYHGMQRHLERVTKDLKQKNQALETDRRLIEIRKPLHGPNHVELSRNVGYRTVGDELKPDPVGWKASYSF